MKLERSSTPESPEVLFLGSYYFSAINRQYDIHPDGQRFLMIKEGGAIGQARRDGG